MNRRQGQSTILAFFLLRERTTWLPDLMQVYAGSRMSRLLIVESTVFFQAIGTRHTANLMGLSFIAAVIVVVVVIPLLLVLLMRMMMMIRLLILLLIK